MHLTPGPIPKHHQLTEILRGQIVEGNLAPDDRFPTEEVLCRQYGISRGTVRRAVDALVREGLIQREQGRGTFVTAVLPQSAFFTLTSFGEDMRRQGRQPGTRLLAAAVEPASAAVAGRLGIDPGQPVIRIARLRLANRQPVVYETRYLAHQLCPNLLDHNLETESIHHLLIHTYRLPLIRASHTMEARVLLPAEANLLNTAPGAPAFFVDRLTYTMIDGAERPAVWYTALYRGDEYHFRAEFEPSIFNKAVPGE
jgi:GntR family transcriptional regulator